MDTQYLSRERLDIVRSPYIIYSTQALHLYDMLGICKERIEPGEPWQNYAETLFSIQRRLADHAFSNARTWPEMLQEHKRWWTNYNSEHHFAHRERQDGRHSPSEVLRGVLGTDLPGRGALACAVCHAVYPPSRPAWICQVQKLAVLWRRRTCRRRGLHLGV